ncbi:MAG: aminoacyl-histidine dipeptidase, partial [Clostridia bacterium]|nr:aminoacyl-histidine dipeptidase [Clostridia bacterium]
MGVLTGIEPQKVFDYFETLCSIPHGSGNTKHISDYIASFANEHGFRYIQDEHNNLIIWKNGTDGYENSDTVILQGHIDMVCEKDEELDFDFEKDGLKLRIENGIISADGTTLGGDDGIAVAYCLAILDSVDIPHPPLEVVLTTDEEIGMLGAAAMDMSPIKGRKLINIDSEDEGYLLVSCAGGVTTKAVVPIQRAPFDGARIKLQISGLMGGHSGVEIDKGRANANTLLGRILFGASKKADFLIESVNGGLKDNAIPRSSEAVIVAKTDEDAEKLLIVIKEYSEIFSHEYRVTDPDITVSPQKCDSTFTPMDTASTKKVIAALVNLPCGIERMSFDIEGLVQTSLNLGILETSEKEVTFSFAVRSSVESEKNALVEKITCLAELLGGHAENTGAYPAWEYRAHSPLRDLFVEVFEKQYGRKPVVQALHAGVECGLFAGRLVELDAISVGPDMIEIHTPNETMSVDRVKRSWDYLLE